MIDRANDMPRMSLQSCSIAGTKTPILAIISQLMSHTPPDAYLLSRDDPGIPLPTPCCRDNSVSWKILFIKRKAFMDKRLRLFTVLSAIFLHALVLAETTAQTDTAGRDDNLAFTLTMGVIPFPSRSSSRHHQRYFGRKGFGSLPSLAW